jgi:hypothetical protein
MRLALLIALATVAAGPAVAQKVYRCTDAKGQPVFQQSACGGNTGDAPKTDAPKVETGAAPASAPAARAPRPCHSAREVDSVRSAASSPSISKAEAERLLNRARDMERCQR